MKKSKLMKALLVFGMSMVTATSIVGLTACDDSHDHVDADNNGKCDICETDMTPQGGGNEDLTVAVEKVELNKTEITLDIGGEETLTATVTPDTATNKTVTWSSDKPDIATVVGGKVTAKASGTATITATAGGKTATCSVTVNEPAPKPDVTAEEWASILESVDNFTLTESTESKTSIQKVDGDKIGLADGSILVKDGEKYYEYRQDVETEKWAKVEISAQIYEATANVFSGFVSGIKDLYEEFDLNDGVYVAKHAVNMAGIGELHNLEVKFNHGKLTGITFQTILEIGGDVIIEGTPAEQADEPTESGGATTETPNPTENLLITSYEVSDVGTTVVPLPKIDGGETPDPEDKAAVTADEWAEIFGGLTNVTVEMKLEGELQSTLKTDGVKVHLISEGGETIYAENEGSYYKYEKTDGKWSKEEITQEAYASELEEDNSYLVVLKSLNTYYSEFDYKDGKYSVAEIEDVVIKNIEVTFDDGKLVSVKCEVDELELSYVNANATTIEVPTVNEVPNITTWTEVTDAINGEVHENDSDFIWHHIFFNDAVAKQYNFDSYEATVKLDGVAGEIVTSLEFNENDIKAHTYHMQIRIKGNRYQTAVFTINFKKDGETVVTGTYTRVGDKEIVLLDDKLSVSESATEPTSFSVLKINGKTDLTGYTINWSISDNTVATIEDKGNGTVEVTGVKEGTATLTCTVGTGDDAFSATCAITVVKGEVKDEDPVDVTDKLFQQEEYGTWNINIRLDCDAELGGKIASVEVTATMDGNTTNVTIHEFYGGTTDKYVKMGVSQDWTHDYVFTLNYKNAAGKVIATGTFTKAAPKTLTLSKSKLELTLKDDETVTETITATTQKVEGEVQWSSSDTSVATVVNGTITAVAEGTATITATVDGLEKTCTVTVHPVGYVPPQTEVETLTVTEVRTDGAVYLIANMGKHFNFSYTKSSCPDGTHDTPTKCTGNNRWDGDTNFFIFAPNADCAPTVSGNVYTIEFYDENDELIARAEVTCP